MQFLFFDSADTVLFAREDAESASVTHEQLQFQALFPFDAGKEIRQGMRVGFAVSTGDYQAFEVRKVRTLEPDHFQEITAEHIAISDLTDEFHQKREFTNRTAEQALSWLLTNTGWAIGTSTASNTSSYDMSIGDVWSAIKNIEQNWNVYILPRVTVNAGGITGKYLDIVPAGGSWRGFRLSLEKNANEIGVTWDDTKLKTALYAFGQEQNGTPLTFKDVVWSKTADHPAKPAGQTYLEDDDATAAFGRNGRPRFGFYQNASITNANTLIQKTWEVLKTVNVPDVCINSTVSDLYRLGYSDVPIRLHDTALVEIRPTGVILHKEIVQYTEDLLDPLQSRLTIGVYIPNIVYINRQANKRFGGGGGSGGQTFMEYTTANNTVQLWNDSNGLHSLCVGTGAQLNPDGSLVVDPVTGKPVFIDTGDNMWSQIEQNKSSISLKVSKGDVATELKVECGNVDIVNGNLTVDGYVTSAGLATEIASLSNVEVNNINGTRAEFDVLDGTIVYADDVQTAQVTLGGNAFTNCIVSASVSGNTLTLTPLSGSPITFSKATTLSGAWSGRRYTVTATPQGETKTGIVYDGLVPTGSITKSGKNVTRDFIVYSDDGEGNADSIIMQKTVTINASSVYDDGVAEGESKFALTTVQLQGASAGTIYKRKTTGSLRLSRYSSSSVELFIYERNQYYSVGNHVWWYQSNSGTYYYLGDGSDNTLFLPGSIVTDTYYTKST